jgi:hypothetical protein
MAFDLNSIKRGKEIKPPTILFYGVHGIGKSSWAADAPNPIFIQTEEGLNQIECAKFPVARTLGQVHEALNTLLNQEHDFKTGVIDTTDWLERLIHNEVKRVNGDKIFTDFGKGYKFAVPYVEEIWNKVVQLRDTRGMAFIFLSHVKQFQFNAPDMPSYDRYAPDMHESMTTILEEGCEAVLFANYKVYVTKEDVGFGKQEGKATGSGARVVYTQERPAFRAKNRYNLPYELPLSFAAFQRAFVEGIKKDYKKEVPLTQPQAPTETATVAATEADVTAPATKGKKKKADDAPPADAGAAA